MMFERRVHSVLLLFGLLIPLLIAGSWGDLYTEAAYQQLQAARTLARGEIASSQQVAPLYTLLLALAAHASLPLPTVALILSTLGWMAAVAVWFRLGLALDHPLFAIVTLLFLSLNPLQPQVLGLETGATLALLGAAALWGMSGRRAAGLMGLLTLAALQPAMLAFAIPFMFLIQMWQRQKPRLTHLVLGLVVGLPLYVLLYTLLTARPMLSLEHEPRLLVGFLMVMQLLAAAGFDRLVPDLTSLAQPTRDWRGLGQGLLSLGLVALGLWQGYTLVQTWRMRPAERLALYQNLAQWMLEQSLPMETIATQRTGLVGYLADRPTLALADDAPMTDLVTDISAAKPDYCITTNSLAWHSVRAQRWFREHYQEVLRLVTPYDAGTPLVIFRYTPLAFDRGETIAATARFDLDPSVLISCYAAACQSDSQSSPAAAEVELTGYRLESQRIIPGEPLHLTLHWRALDNLDRLHQSPWLILTLMDPGSGRVWARAENATPGGLRLEAWKAGTQMADRYTLVPPDDIPPGDYALAVAFQRKSGRLATVELGTDAPPSIHVLENERLLLTKVSYPPAVSHTPPTPEHRLDYVFDPNIRLLGYDVPHRISPGETLRLSLYWHAAGPVAQDYKVFTHLLAPGDELIAQHDSRPLDGSLPTTDWQTGDYVRDEHLLPIDPDTPRGDYILSIGLYDPASGDRALARDGADQLFSTGRIVLQKIQVR
jgi:hypothetical protein